MKSMVAVFFFTVVAFFGRADAQVDIKIGGGALLDPTRGGRAPVHRGSYW